MSGGSKEALNLNQEDDRKKLIELFKFLGLKHLLVGPTESQFLQSLFSSSSEEAEALKEVLLDAHAFVESLKKEHGLSQGDIRDWWALYSSMGQGRKLKEEIPKYVYSPPLSRGEGTAWDRVDAVADHSMSYTYLALNALGIVVGWLMYASGVGPAAMTGVTAATAIGATWNYIDVVGGFVQAAKAFRDKNHATGSALFLSSAQLLSFSLAANIGYYVTQTVSASMAASFMGFSFAGCMAIAVGIEVAKYRECGRKMKTFKEQMDGLKGEYYKALKAIPGVEGTIERLEKDINESKNSQDLKLLQQDLISKKQELKGYEQTINKYQQLQTGYYMLQAKQADHKRAAISWGACTVGMLGVALAASLAAGPFAPAALIGVAAVATITGAMRIWWKNRVKHADNLQEAFARPKGGGKNLKERLDSLCAEEDLSVGNVIVNLREEVTMKGLGKFSDTKISFEEYLNKMLHTNPKKAEAIIKVLEDALENDNVTLEELDKALDIRRGVGFKVGKSTGQKILDKLINGTSDNQQRPNPDEQMNPV